MIPRMEVVIVNHSQPLLTGSALDSVTSNVFDPEITGGGGNARAPMFDDMEAEINALFGQ